MTDLVKEYIRRIDESADKAFNCQSKLKAADFTNPGCKPHWRGVESMNLPEYLHLLNNLCSYPDVVHMHIGFWKGGSLFPCLEGNPTTKVYAADNFFSSEELEEEFKENSRRLGFDGRYELFDCNYRDIALSQITDKINFHLYDADHNEEEQYYGVYKFDPALADVFILLIDGWNLPGSENQRDGTWRAINSRGWEVCYEKPLLGTEHGKWHTGHGIFVLKK